MLGNELLKLKLAAAATGRGAGDAGDSFRIEDTVGQQGFDLLRGGAAAIADYVVFGFRLGGIHETIGSSGVS